MEAPVSAGGPHPSATAMRAATISLPPARGRVDAPPARRVARLASISGSRGPCSRWRSRWSRSTARMSRATSRCTGRSTRSSTWPTCRRSPTRGTRRSSARASSSDSGRRRRRRVDVVIRGLDHPIDPKTGKHVTPVFPDGTTFPQNEAIQPPLYYVAMTPIALVVPWSQRVLVMRLAGTLFVMLAVLLLYAAVREVEPPATARGGARSGDPRRAWPGSPACSARCRTTRCCCRSASRRSGCSRATCAARRVGPAAAARRGRARS